MRTKLVSIYQFDELSDTAKEKARARYRDGYPFYDWYECVFEDAKTLGAAMGIEIDRIYFSGFSSQGDGACFEGSYRYKAGSTWAVKSHAPKDTWLHSISENLQSIQRQNFYRLHATAKHRGHYYHSNCTDVNVWDRENPYRDVGASEDETVGLLREFMNWIYRQLENEYEWLTSDECVDENIRADECEFDENGNPA
jgi:hypothetical protein